MPVDVSPLVKELGLAGYPVDDDEDVSRKKIGSAQDRQDMWRIGRVQEMNRNFRFLSTFGFSTIVVDTWEYVMFTSSAGMIDGGRGGMIYTYIGATIGYTAVVLSLAEMASMAPTSGGQFHWVSEFAPPRYQKFLSYITGWLCALGWHIIIATSCYSVASMLLGVIAINHPVYVPHSWQGSLLIMATGVIAFSFSTFLAQKLPLIEGLVLVMYVFGFFAILIPLWVLGKPIPASEVFGSIQDRGGWGNLGLSCLIGIVSPIYALLGPDSAVHMSEEIRDASRILPLGMILSLLLNEITGFIMLVTYIFCIDNLDDIINSTAVFPFIQVFVDKTGSIKAATAMTVIIIVLQAFACVNYVATASRQLYSLARDKGLPMSSFLSHVHPRFLVPLNALCVSLMIVCLLSLINIFSTVAFSAIVSLGTGSILSSYMISISCIRLKRWRGELLPPTRWSMGHWASSIETFAILFLVITFIFTFFPLTRQVTPDTMNWSVVIYSGVVIFSLLYYVFFGKNSYTAPVTHIRQFS